MFYLQQFEFAWALRFQSILKQKQVPWEINFFAKNRFWRFLTEQLTNVCLALAKRSLWTRYISVYQCSGRWKSDNNLRESADDILPSVGTYDIDAICTSSTNQSASTEIGRNKRSKILKVDLSFRYSNIRQKKWKLCKWKAHINWY